MPGFDRFGKRWGSSGQVETPTDNNANLGFAFLGSEPPSAELHNQLFQWLDEKDNYLFALLNEVMRERTGNELAGSPITQLAAAIATAATINKAGIQRNATGQITLAMESSEHTVTPASLKPLIDSLVLGITNSVPSGGVLAFARSSPPIGWLVADGRAVSRSQYIELFNAIGTTFGAGNGSTTFNLPNLNGRVVRGWNSTAIGLDAGRAFGSVQADQNKRHTHISTAEASGAHSHTTTVETSGSHTHTGGTTSSGSHSHGYTDYRTAPSSASAGAGTGSGFTTQALSSTTQAAGSHSHSVSVDTAGAHTHSVSVDTAGAHTHAITVGNEGGDEVRVANIALLYCIKI